MKSLCRQSIFALKIASSGGRGTPNEKQWHPIKNMVTKGKDEEHLNLRCFVIMGYSLPSGLTSVSFSSLPKVWPGKADEFLKQDGEIGHVFFLSTQMLLSVEAFHLQDTLLPFVP